MLVLFKAFFTNIKMYLEEIFILHWIIIIIIIIYTFFSFFVLFSFIVFITHLLISCYQLMHYCDLIHNYFFAFMSSYIFFL